jgi:hypothetical protein
MKFRLSGKIAKLVSFCAISSLVCGAAVNPQDYLTANGSVNKAAVSYALQRGASAADIAAALAKKSPARAKEFAALLASMAPTKAGDIAAAVAKITPAQVVDIATAVTAKVPTQSRKIYTRLARAFPLQRKQIKAVIQQVMAKQVATTTPTQALKFAGSGIAQQVEADLQSNVDDVTTSNLTTETNTAPTSAP